MYRAARLLLSRSFSTTKLLSQHSRSVIVDISPNLSVIILPIFSDNYCYLVVDSNAKRAAAVDPADPIFVQNAANEQKLNISHVLTTHHHDDHTAGNEKLASEINDLEVVGSDSQRIPSITKLVKHSDTFPLGPNAKSGLEVEVVATPCHTDTHVSYVVRDSREPSSAPVLFSGDTLFVSGCGRFFEGTARDMFNSLQNYDALPDDTLVFCGHEYTLSNLRFARSIEPDNDNLKERLAWAEARRQSQLPTVPTTLGIERKTNPFLRVRERVLAKKLGFTEWSNAETSFIETMAELRRRKDEYRD